MDRLPRGRHGLSPEFVARNQRQRLIAGLTQALYEVGYQKTTVSLIGQRASVSKSDFYKHFESKDDCFIAAYDAAVGRVRERVLASCETAEGKAWALRVSEAIEVLLKLLASDPALASIALVEGLRAGRGVYDRYQGAIESFVTYLRDGAPAGPDAPKFRRRRTKPSSAGSPRCWGVACWPAKRSSWGSYFRRFSSSSSSLTSAWRRRGE